MDNQNNLDLDDAIRADVAAFSGTKSELSRRVCGSSQALSHKMAGFKNQFLRPEELIDLQLHSDSRNTITAMAHALGGVYLQLPPLNPDLDNAELELKLMAVSVRMGKLFSQMTQAQADGVIDENERRLLNQRAHDLQTAVQEWLVLSFYLYRENQHE